MGIGYKDTVCMQYFMGCNSPSICLISWELVLFSALGVSLTLVWGVGNFFYQPHFQNLKKSYS